MLKNRGESVLAIADKERIHTLELKRRYVAFSLIYSDIFRSSLLLLVRLYALFRLLNKNYVGNKDVCMAHFFNTYIYLSYFYRVLTEVQPKYVVTANDHSAANRSLLAVAHKLGIKTVYLQHASVSNLFPALRVNYAFLDGLHSLNTYRECENNQPSTTREAPVPVVILSGQKKQLQCAGRTEKKLVGLALNRLDDYSSVIELVNSLINFGCNVCVRWHPGQHERDVQQLIKYLEYNSMATFSDPKTDSLSAFLERIRWLVAGNSSIHLEAALANVIPIYYEITPPDSHDYYGYVKHGLAKFAKSYEDILDCVLETKSCHRPEINAIRYYSSTYLTNWDGREGELVADCLICLINGEKLPVPTYGL
ncbi:hypothetical protein [Billgrantia lactosivorans]|uniref:hypothetical protein n=1 Tax=Billgrantia lactosivorans TaxID=2185141 RepID=UPI0013A6CB29|nr:hypothetical protein [Halomonas lactosivorans]